MRRWRGKLISSVITEVEAYDGPMDKGSHAFRGQTKRNAPMFGPSGFWYVYLCYGVHWMLNYVVGDEGYPAAILIRSTSDVRGPGKLTAHFHISGAQNGTMAAPTSGLWIEDRAVHVTKNKMKTLPRVGIPYAQDWKDRPMRFILDV